MTNSFHPREFNQCMFDPIRVPEGEDILKFYKDLAKYKEFRVSPGEEINNTKLMLYIICIYDKNSPYRKKFSDVLKRKIEVAHDVGFPTEEEGGRFLSPVEDFLKGNNEKVNKKIVAYVRMHRNFKYSYLVTLEASYYSMMLEIINGDNSSIKEARNVQKELEETLLEILNEDNNPQVRDELLKYMEDERLGLRPEDIAQKLREGKKPV